MKEIPFIMLDDKNSGVPLYRQIYAAIRRSILSGEFESRMRLPASRLLAKQLGVSRMTVINAYEQLYAEGYLEGKIGAGTFVAASLPEDFLQTPRFERKKQAKNSARNVRLSAYGKHLTNSEYAILRDQSPSKFVPFQHGVTAYDKFPFDIWAKITQRRQRNYSPQLLGYGELAGFQPLREAVAAHLGSARGVKCTAEQVIITNGTQQAVDLIARILLEPQDEVWMEEPCYRGARDVFTAAGAKISHFGVDGEGFDVEKAQNESQTTARMIYVTPSHQFPLGMTMSLPRRLNLLEQASENEMWILEDDYNSEFRYAGRPLASLQGLDRSGRVIYIGTFSKTIFPALRLGCLVLPADLIEVFTAGRALTDVHSPIMNQAILADFIAEGHFARHLRRMRKLYEERQEILIAEVKRLGGLIEISKADAGMHVIGWLSEKFNDADISNKAAESGLNITPVSAYRNRKSPRGGLVFGYTAFDEKQIKDGIGKLAKVFESEI